MLICKRLRSLPENFPEFLEELVDGYLDLYGEAAAAEYRTTVSPSMSQSMGLAQVVAFAAYSGARVVGMAMSVMHMGVGKIAFIHVLGKYRESGVEAQLVQASVEVLQQQTPTRIECETIPLYSVNLKMVFEGLGFRCIERALMIRKLEGIDGEDKTNCTRQMQTADEIRVVNCLVDAYHEHPDVELHLGLQHADAAMELLRRFQSGAFGPAKPEWIRVMEDDQGCCGVILGHAMPPDTGYIFQLAVQPSSQSQGRGTALIKGLLSSMANAGMKQVLLGVTISNPAMGLYERLGFQVHRHVDVFVQDREAING